MSANQRVPNLVHVFHREYMQISGNHGAMGPYRPSMAELDETARSVLQHLSAIKPGSVTLAAAGSGLAHEVDFSHEGVAARFTVQCSGDQGIVFRTPLSTYEGPALRTPKIAPAVEDFAGGGPVSFHMEELLADRYDLEGRLAYSMGQGGEHGFMFQLKLVSEAPGPSSKYMVYQCTTTAELACFLDSFLGTYVWDAICAEAGF